MMPFRACLPGSELVMPSGRRLDGGSHLLQTWTPLSPYHTAGQASPWPSDGLTITSHTSESTPVGPATVDAMTELGLDSIFLG
jgi:hypothetical protein